MVSWRKIRLGDICEIERGGSPRPIKDYITNRDDGVNWIKIGDTSSNSMYITSTKEKIIPEGVSKSRFVKSGDFLLTNSMSFGRPYILKVDGCIHDGWLVIRDEKNFFNKQFLYYLLSSDYMYSILKNMAVGGVVNNLNSQMVRNLELNVPTIDIQDKIAVVLEKAQELIDKRKVQMEALDELVKSKFIEMFGNENSIFDKWKVITISDISDVGVGVVIKPADYYTDANNGIKTFRSLNVGEMYIKDKDWVYFTNEGNDKNKKSILKEGQILIVRSGYPGTACLVTKEYEGCNAIDVIIATPNKEKINPTYMCAFTNYPHGKNQILEGQAGAAQKHFNVGAYKKMKIALPPLEIQNEFVRFFNQVDKLKFEMQESLTQLEGNFDSLMQRAFKGELFI